MREPLMRVYSRNVLSRPYTRILLLKAAGTPINDIADVRLAATVSVQKFPLLRISPSKYKMSVQNVHLLLHIVLPYF